MMKLTAIANGCCTYAFGYGSCGECHGFGTEALTGAVYNDLNSMQMDLAMINDLTLGQIHQIDQIMSSGDSESEKRNKINNILRDAGQK